DRQVDRNLLFGDIHLAAHADIRFQRLVDYLDALKNPGIRAGEELRRGPVQDVGRRGPQNTQSGVVAGNDLAVLVEGDDAVRHALKHALVVVLHVLDVVEQFRVLQADGKLRGKRFEARFIVLGERPTLFVQSLSHADDL